YNPINILSMLAWGLGYFGMPHILIRFMAVEDAAKLRLSRRIATVWVVVSLSVAVLIGLIGNAMTAAGAVPALVGPASETLIVKIVALLAGKGWIAAIVAGVILSGILAATMSTADSQLLAASSSVSQNLLQESLGIKLSEKKSFWLARLTVVGIAVVGVILAFDPNSSVFEIVSFAWAGFGATFGPVVLCALFWKRSNLWGALSGMGVGAVANFYLEVCGTTLRWNLGHL
ncbi:Sodium/solute symporter, partial [gut metagenome]